MAHESERRRKPNHPKAPFSPWYTTYQMQTLTLNKLVLRIRYIMENINSNVFNALAAYKTCVLIIACIIACNCACSMT